MHGQPRQLLERVEHLALAADELVKISAAIDAHDGAVALDVLHHPAGHVPQAGRGDGPRGDMPPAPQFDTVAANQRLTQAGYSAFGLMRQEGPRVLLDATNPDGETVTLELDPQGQLVRETAR